jgi:hypothetical protein
MASREAIKAVILYMKGSFPNYHPELDGKWNAIDVLLDQLGDLSEEDLMIAVRAACTPGTGREFAPSADEIRTALVHLRAHASNLPTAGEAWAAIMESFKRTSFSQPELLKHPMIQEAVRCMGGMNVIGMSEENMADRAHFLKIYEGLYNRALRDAAQLPIVTEYVEAQRLEVTSEVKRLADKLAHKRNVEP